MRITYETNFVATDQFRGIPSCMKGTSFEVLMR